MNAEIVKKDGLVLVREMAAEVKNMLDFKMNAVMVRELKNTMIFPIISNYSST